MGLIDKLKSAFALSRRDRGRKRPRSGTPKAKADVGNLPGGASAKEAADASPQRAAELAD